MEGVVVGAVLGGDGKKVTDLSVEEYKATVLDHVRQLDEERRDDTEDESETEARLDCLSVASVQFSMLETNISQPVKLQFFNQNSSFVLYNLARMHQLLRTFDHLVNTNMFPPLPDHINVSLLSEPGEWEIIFNFMLSYSQVLRDSAEQLNLQKIVIFLNSLACSFSKYYNRVKILKDSLPHLVPCVHARIFFIKLLSQIVVDALSILNIKFVSKM